MFHDDDRVRAAAERCARLESWLQVEQNQAKREEIAEALREARETLAKELQRFERERGIEPKADADRMFPSGNVTDFLKKLDEAAAGRKEAAEQPQKEAGRAEDRERRSRGGGHRCRC